MPSGTLAERCFRKSWAAFRNLVVKSTLADANELRDWRIWHDVAAILIRRARKYYVDDDIRLDLDNTVYAFDSTGP